MSAMSAFGGRTSTASRDALLCVHERLPRDTIVPLGGGAVPLLSVADGIAVMGG
jgi:hypothetical protein